jgi:hypothetical protein
MVFSVLGSGRVVTTLKLNNSQTNWETYPCRKGSGPLALLLVLESQFVNDKFRYSNTSKVKLMIMAENKSRRQLYQLHFNRKHMYMQVDQHQQVKRRFVQSLTRTRDFESLHICSQNQCWQFGNLCVCSEDHSLSVAE